MTSLEILIAKTALKKMESQGYFDICIIDNILKISGGIPDARLYQMLRTLHCINYKDMPRELLNELPTLIKDVLSSAPLDIIKDDIFIGILRNKLKSLN